MRLLAVAEAVLAGATARLRRDATALAVATDCALGAVVMLASASVMALEPEVGGVYARLIVGGVFVLLAGATLLLLHLARAERRNDAALGAALSTHAGGDEALRRQTQFAQIAMIVEAALLGYSLSRRNGRR